MSLQCILLLLTFLKNQSDLSHLANNKLHEEIKTNLAAR